MNRGPLLFIGAFLAMSISWFGMILTPQLQIGAQNPGEAADRGTYHPHPKSGDAQAGLQVYRAAGCVHCHSQQVDQSGVIFDVTLTKAGMFTADVTKEIMHLNPLLRTAVVNNGVANTNGFTFLRDVTKEEADYAIEQLGAIGGNVEAALTAKPTGVDIQIGWGARRSVARDYLYDYPVLLGSQRIGPDLLNIGNRQSNADWHYRHLYRPRSVVKGSAMPEYRYLFEVRERNGEGSPDALDLEALGMDSEMAGKEIVPTDKAKKLVAYLLSLRNGPRLFETPMPKQPKPSSEPQLAVAGAE